MKNKLANIVLVLMVLLSALSVPSHAQTDPHWCWAENYKPERCVPLFVPVEYPASLDDLYRLIETQAPGWTFDTPCQDGLPTITWPQVRMITALAQDDNDAGRLVIDAWLLRLVVRGGGVRVPDVARVDVSEDYLFGALLLQIGDVTLCGDGAGYPVMQGAGVQALFDALGGG